MTSSGLKFGIYPHGVAGTPTGLAVGPKDEPEKIKLALKELQGATKTLLPRCYAVYMGTGMVDKVLASIENYVSYGLKWDLALGFREPGMELDGWLDFIRQIVRRYSSSLVSLEITGEANLSFMDGASPNVQQALVQGVILAKEELKAAGAPVEVGFGVVPDNLEPALPGFWESLSKLVNPAFLGALDYVGYDIYPDVFEPPVAQEALPGAVESLLRRLREGNLTTGGIPASVPIRIAENGWPTGKHPFTGEIRTYEQQSRVLETVIRTIYRLRHELNISHYALFGLRDADSANDEIFHQFGVMRSDYTPKPAFYTFQHLIQELGV